MQDDIDTPAERMKFLQSVAQALYTKARLKLNIKRLYSADGKAVPELLKVTDLLFIASQQATSSAEVTTDKTDECLSADCSHMAVDRTHRVLCLSIAGLDPRVRLGVGVFGAVRKDCQGCACGCI